MELIRIPHRIADIADGQLGQFEQLRCFCHPVAEKELLGRFPHSLFEDTPKVGAVQPAEGSDILDGDIVLEVLFDIIERLFYIEVSYPSACRHL